MHFQNTSPPVNKSYGIGEGDSIREGSGWNDYQTEPSLFYVSSPANRFGRQEEQTGDYMKATVRPAITMLTIDMSLMRMLSDGPLVSLKGSPTVSPTTVAL